MLKLISSPVQSAGVCAVCNQQRDFFFVKSRNLSVSQLSALISSHQLSFDLICLKHAIINDVGGVTYQDNIQQV